MIEMSSHWKSTDRIGLHGLAAFLLLAGPLAAGLPDVTVLTLDEQTFSGTLQNIDESRFQIESTEGRLLTVPVDNVRSLHCERNAPAADVVFADPPAVMAELLNGSLVAGRSLTASASEVKIDAESLGDLSLPMPLIRSIRLGEIGLTDQEIEKRWEALRPRQSSMDTLVIRKGDVLDFVEGTVGKITSDAVAFLLGDQNVEVPRQRVFGIIYARTPAKPAEPAVHLLFSRSRLVAQQITFDGSRFQARLARQQNISLPADQVFHIEYAGRVRPLIDLPEAVEYPEQVTKYDQMTYFRKGTASNGQPLRIGADQQITSDGLWIHSEVTVRYRINRDYRRFLARVGMDHNVGGNKAVRLRILGDGSALFDEIIRKQDPSRLIDLDVSTVRDLEIRVERVPEIAKLDPFGIQEHLDLGEARLIR